MDAPARRAPTSRRALKWWLIGAGAVLLLLAIGVTGWIGVRGWLAKEELERAAALAADVQAGILDQDADTAEAAARSLIEHTGQARSLTDDPVWRAAEVLGTPGANLRAVRVLAAEFDDVASGAVFPLADLARTIDVGSFRPVEGRVDLAPLVEARPTVASALEALQRGSERMNAVSSDGLIGPVADARDQFADTLVEVRDLVAGLDGAVRLLPSMLGGDGPRTYLVLFQNNAELRTGGGIAGALALMRAEAGTVTLVAQASSQDFSPRPWPDLPGSDLPVPASTAAVYGDTVGSYIQNVTMTPDFPLTASLASQMWAYRFGDHIDGVIAVDPVALSYLLDSTGAVPVVDGTSLSAENAVQTLLVDAYTRFDGDQQDAFFAAAASACFSAITAGTTDGGKLVDGLVRASRENRIAIWSADAAEQAILAETTLAGMAAAHEQAGPENYAVYLNDATGAKMDPYLDLAIDVGAVAERDDGRSEVTVRLTMKNTAPADAGETFPRYVTGAGIFGITAGTIATNVSVAAPAGAFDGGVTENAEAVGYATAVDGGVLVNSMQVRLVPGEVSVVEFRFISAKPGQAHPNILHTPMMSEVTVGAL